MGKVDKPPKEGRVPQALLDADYVPEVEAAQARDLALKHVPWQDLCDWQCVAGLARCGCWLDARRFQALTVAHASA